jgi:hypothetical protein
MLPQSWNRIAGCACIRLTRCCCEQPREPVSDNSRCPIACLQGMKSCSRHRQGARCKGRDAVVVVVDRQLNAVADKAVPPRLPCVRVLVRLSHRSGSSKNRSDRSPYFEIPIEYYPSEHELRLSGVGALGKTHQTPEVDDVHRASSRPGPSRLALRRALANQVRGVSAPLINSKFDPHHLTLWP